MLEIDPLTGRPVLVNTRPPSPMGGFMQGLGSGFRSVFGASRNNVAGSPELPPGAAGVDAAATQMGIPNTPQPVSGPTITYPDPQPNDLIPNAPPTFGPQEAGLAPGFSPGFAPGVEPASATPPVAPSTMPTAMGPQEAGTAPGFAPGVSSQAPAAPAGPAGQAPAPRPGTFAPQGALTGVSPDSVGPDNSFEQGLARRESSGRPDAVNPFGYAGLFQFGAPLLQTLGVYQPGANERLDGWGRSRDAAADGRWTGTFNIPGFENVRTLQDFLGNEGAQRAVFRQHVSNIDRAIDALPGAENYDRNGLRAVAHLGGIGGMRQFVQTNGQYDPGDANGTRLSNYYRSFAGSNAPNGLEGRLTGSRNPQNLQPDGLTGSDQAPPPGSAAGSTWSSGRDGPGAEALIAAGAGVLSGRTLNEGLARGGAAFVGQMNTENQRADQRADRREARSDRLAQNAQLDAYRRAQLALQQQRVNAVANRGTGTATNIQSATRLNDPETNTTYISGLRRDGTPVLTTLDGQEVTDQAVIRRLRQGNDPSAAPEARDLIEQRNTAFSEAAAARTLRPSIASARRVLQENPNITGQDWPTQATRWIATTLGINVGSMREADVAMLQQALQQGNMQTLMQIAPSLRPMSNVDLQAISQMSPSLMTNPRMIGAWLEQMDKAASRTERMGDALAAVLADEAQTRAMARSGGVAAWRQRFYSQETAQDRPNGQVQPQVQPGQTPAGPGWTNRTPSGIGFSFN